MGKYIQVYIPLILMSEALGGIKQGSVVLYRCNYQRIDYA